MSPTSYRTALPRDNNKGIKFNGGGRGIRTPARYDPPVGFQDRSLQPNLGIPPKLHNRLDVFNPNHLRLLYYITLLAKIAIVFYKKLKLVSKKASFAKLILCVLYP